MPPDISTWPQPFGLRVIIKFYLNYVTSRVFLINPDVVYDVGFRRSPLRDHYDE